MSINPLTENLNMVVYKPRGTVGAKADSAVPAAKDAKSDTKTAEKGEEFSFWDLVDIINPLQHIPVVNTIYRELTGDKINNFSRVAGGALFGGFVGAIVGGVNAVAVNESGSDLGEMAMHKMGIGNDKKPEATASATASAAVPSVAPVAVPEAAKAGDKNIPVIEVRPLAKAEAAPEKTGEIQPKNSVAKDAAQEAALKPQNGRAEEFAAAMPSPEDLNALEPGNPASAMPSSVASDVQATPAAAAPQNTIPSVAPVKPSEIPQNMMQALSKYQSMQNMGDANKVADNAGVSKSRFSQLDKTVRRY